MIERIFADLAEFAPRFAAELRQAGFEPLA